MKKFLISSGGRQLTIIRATSLKSAVAIAQKAFGSGVIVERVAGDKAKVATLELDVAADDAFLRQIVERVAVGYQRLLFDNHDLAVSIGVARAMVVLWHEMGKSEHPEEPVYIDTLRAILAMTKDRRVWAECAARLQYFSWKGELSGKQGDDIGYGELLDVQPDTDPTSVWGLLNQWYHVPSEHRESVIAVIARLEETFGRSQTGFEYASRFTALLMAIAEACEFHVVFGPK